MRENGIPSASVIRDLFVPSIVAFAIACLAVYVAFVSESRIARGRAERELYDAKIITTNRLDNAIAGAESVKALFLSSEKTTESEFDIFAAAIATQAAHIGMDITLEWLDENNVIRYVYPRSEANLRLVGVDINKFPNRLIPIEKARSTNRPVATNPIMLAQGYPGMLLYVPIFRDKTYLGMALSVVRMSDLLSETQRYVEMRGRRAYVKTEGFILPFDGKAIFTTKGERIVDPQGTLVADPASAIYDENAGDIVEIFPVADKTWTLRMTSEGEPMFLQRIAAYGGFAGAMVIVVVMLLAGMYRRQQQLSQSLMNERASLKLNEEAHAALEREAEHRKTAAINLAAKNRELEKINAALVGREIAMIELKKRIAELEEKESSGK